MTKEEIKNIIEAKGAEYGFKMQKIISGLTSEQINENFVRIEVLEKDDNEKTSWNDRTRSFHKNKINKDKRRRCVLDKKRQT